MRRQQRATRYTTLIALFLAIAAAAVIFLSPPQAHPYLVFNATDSLQITFIKNSQASRAQCEATIRRMARALETCATCRLVEHRCLDELDARQRKILHGRPVDVPVMRIPDGAVAFTGSAEEVALLSCHEGVRQTAPMVRGQAQCVAPGIENLALSVAKLSTRSSPPLPRFIGLLLIGLLAAVISFLVCYALIRSEKLHRRFTHDSTEAGPQKFHATPTPRIGGVAIGMALASIIPLTGSLGWVNQAAAEGVSMLTLAAIPAFLGGFGEDVTKRVGVLARLLFTVTAGLTASLLVGATLDRLDVPGIDALLHWPIIAITFTAFAVGGVANAVNIIDGYHGLVGGYAILVLGALSLVAYQVGDPVVLTSSLTMIGALLGFLLWNYPRGKIFLGDGGAYLLGFWLAELSVLLVVRNPEVSPWFPFVLLAYPVFETFFSIYRRTILRGRSPGSADALHLHQLIYRRLARVSIGSQNPMDKTRRNSKVAPYIWIGTGLSILPSCLLWRSSLWLVLVSVIFCLAYLWLYLRLIHWRAPIWMISSNSNEYRSRC